MNKVEYVEEVFHHLHRIPENQLQEYQTVKFIADELIKFGFQVEEKVECEDDGSTGFCFQKNFG